MKSSQIKYDCRHLRGDAPYIPSKLRNKICHTCHKYSQIQPHILIILRAIGNVIRYMPLLVCLRKIFPSSHITWLTHAPEILLQDQIHEICRFSPVFLYKVQNTVYDIAVNLDKDKESCILLRNVNAKQKFGFSWQDNHIVLATPKAEHKLITGIFDNI